MNKHVKKEIEFAGKPLILETGDVAVQANMAVKATYGDSIVLATVVSSDPKPEQNFFPLSVEYIEKLYASGTIKTSRFIKRDGRPSDEAVVTRRLIDHAIRPLFPVDYGDEVQVVVTVLSLDPASDPVFLSMIAVSAALYSSDIPWVGPMSSVRIGYKDNEYLVNPSFDDLRSSGLDMIVSFAGKDRKFLAVEAEADLLPEEVILEGIKCARDNTESIVDLLEEFAGGINPDGEKYEYKSAALNKDLVKDVGDIAKDKVVEMLARGDDKTEIETGLKDLMDEIYEKLEGKYKKDDMTKALADIEKRALQHLILGKGKRPDGRKVDEVRQVSGSVGILPRAHGSALFSRGLTQVLTAVTLGSPSLEQIIQDMYGERTRRFMHFYNFPPYSVGEVGKIGYPGGREIGHGMLVEKALNPVIPDQDSFPYTIVLMSETLSSSGSSSMASACSGAMALMDAGVPISEMVAGVGVGLITNDDSSKYEIMTDLAYMEDAFGCLDFKMTGTKTGVTAIQADMKLQGIPVELISEIIEQSKKGRLQILEEMKEIISSPRKEVSKYAPKTSTVRIDVNKIGVVIGSGGRTIKQIQESTDSIISIEPDGTVVVTADSEEKTNRAVREIEDLLRDVESGEIYDGKVKEITEFGAFVEVMPGKTGLLHISEISNSFVKNVRDHLKVGDTVRVKVIGMGENGKFSLSMKAADGK